jgi:hypothetical protein
MSQFHLQPWFIFFGYEVYKSLELDLPQRILRLEMKFVKIDGVAQTLTVRRQSAGCLDCLTSKLRSQNLTFQALILSRIFSVWACEFAARSDW